MSAVEGTTLPRVLVIGSGAVGSFLGGMLAAAGHEVVLLDRRVLGGDDATRLRIEGPDGSQVVPVRRVVDAADAGEPGCIVLAVKIFHLDGALETAARWPGAALLTVQNGVGRRGAGPGGAPRAGAGRLAHDRGGAPARRREADAHGRHGRGGGPGRRARTRAAPSRTSSRRPGRAPACPPACTRTPRR